MDNSGLTSHSAEAHHLSELRILLLGNRAAGKRSTADTILGREEFNLRRSAQCVKRQGEVAGRQVTVVETPGWWDNFLVKDTAELTKNEILLGVSRCPPGLHSLLLHIRVDKSFTEERRRAVQEHLELLSERVWGHTMVLFTYGDWLGDTTIEQHIESEGKALQWLVEKCGNRYHVLNNRNRGVGTQVTKLLEKIEEMVAGNSGCLYEIDRERLKEVEKRGRAEEERAKERVMEVQKWRKTLRSKMGNQLHLSELRILLLGNRAAGKRSTANTILGREEFNLRRSAQCVKRQGEVAGRQVTVVETPGWWDNFLVKDTPGLTKNEILLGVSRCPPGLHSLLLHIRVDKSFTEERQRAVQEHLELLSERVWGHTMVLFTYGDWLGDTTIEQHIESEGKTLQWLVEKCGNRYHVLNNENRDDGTQVTELLEKIEEMVAGNSGCLYEIDRERLQEVEERGRAEEERAKERVMEVQKRREILRSKMGNQLHLSELRILLLGNRAAGKRSTANTILGREEFNLRRSAQCVKRQGEVAGRQVTVVETPGWWDSFLVKDTAELTKNEILLGVSLCPPGLHSLLLHIRVDTSFTEERRRAVQEHLELLSERVWGHTMVLFTYGDWLGDTTIEQHIESEGKNLQWLVEKCGNRYHVLNNENRGDGTQVTELLEKIEEMVAGNSGCLYEIDRERLQEVEEKRGAEEEKVVERQMRLYKDRSTLKYVMGDVHHLPEPRIVLLGYNDAGKSSTGNTILGRGEFETGLRRSAQCVKKQREVAGRLVTVIDTPGWCANELITYTPELVKKEILLSVSLCPPGPHTLLLLIRMGWPFPEERRRAVQEHLELLSERVWGHTMVLFTYGDWLGDTTIEQHIESEGKNLQWLVEKCGNRYHVLNNENRGDGTQVTELLEKIEEMVARNNGCHYEMNREILEEVEQSGKMEERRAEEMKVQEVTKPMEEMEVAKSIGTPPNMGDDDSSGFVTQASPIGSEAGSVQRSLKSAASKTSGFASLMSGSLPAGDSDGSKGIKLQKTEGKESNYEDYQEHQHGEASRKKPVTQGKGK